ncbi:Serine/threonine-protein kinase SRPK [Tolypocladium ophioglossoides CBS 100239]|uniref:Serine/threonine-protein kinase SRPK n=1 Tax=Tolypocladium ophioglossoides (strain CBS 100239) TaxID=1163406 RepID=A0A0L0N2Q3_TOLOC|nr:Serine/threonine-protein kinase SRPK [Tolypocladium ophioglossoides CBS 100239]
MIVPSQRVEEERLSFYMREEYYPILIGEVLQDRYQVVAKLGYGTSSTVWLSHDLREQRYLVLKVHINTLKHNQELKVHQHLAGINTEHPGREYVRRFEDSFKLKGPNSEHDVFIMIPLGISLRTLQEMQKDNVFQQSLVVTALDQVILGLSFLHEADVIHTDNLLVAITDDSVLFIVEENEIHKPSARKQIGDIIIYARIGREHHGIAMPVPYRAPEVILNMTWGTLVDAWSIGLLAWDLLERGNLFRVYDYESEEQNDAHHLAAMTTLLGPPPPEFLKRSTKTCRYWNELGQWHGPVPLPLERKVESLAGTLAGEDKEMLLNFIQFVLCWLPEQRLTTLQAYFHPWWRGKGS